MTDIKPFLRDVKFRLCLSVSNSSIYPDQIIYNIVSSAEGGGTLDLTLMLSEYGPFLSLYFWFFLLLFLLFLPYEYLHSFRHGDYKFERDRYGLSCHCGFRKRQKGLGRDQIFQEPEVLYLFYQVQKFYKSITY